MICVCHVAVRVEKHVDPRRLASRPTAGAAAPVRSAKLITAVRVVSRPTNTRRAHS